MKRLSEKFKQAWGLGSNSKEWRPTSNGRNDAMLKDVRKFAMNLKQTHKQIKDLSTAVDTSMSMFRTVLLSPLPRAYDEMPAGVLPIDREVHLIGLNVTPEGLTAASVEVQQRLQQDVVVPLEQWLSAYRETKDLYKKCEAIRLDLDNKRRTVLVLQEKYQAKSKDGNRSKEAEAALHKVVNEEDKLTRLAQRYAEMEAQVFNAFLQLIRDSAMLRDFIASSLAFLQRCFTSAYTAFEVAPPPPMPVLPAPAPVPLLAYTPADINVSMRISANSMSQMSSSQGGAASSGMTGSPPKKSHMSSARPTGSAGSASNLGQSYGTTPQLLTSATFSHTTTTQPAYTTATAPYPQAPPSPNADTMRRASQNHGFYPSRQPSSPNADQLPMPASTMAPVPPPHPAPTKQHSATALVPQTAWRVAPPPIPEQPLHSSRPGMAVAAPASENGSMDDGVNPFEQPLPAAPTHQVTRDPQNPFASEDGTGRQAIPA